MGCYLFNNKRRDHKKLFGEDAVYDIDWPAQRRDWNRLTFGGSGRVLRWADKPKGNLVLDVFKLTGWRPTTNPETGGEVRIVQGIHEQTQTISYEEARRDHPRIFDKLGRLKQVSVI